MKQLLCILDENTDYESDKYINVNSCGYYGGLNRSHVNRKQGRADYQLIYVKRGEIKIYDMDKTVTISSGDACLYRPREPQEYGVNHTETDYFWIHFSGREAKNMLSFWTERTYHVGTIPEIERFCREFCNEYNTPGFCSTYFEGCLITLFGILSRQISPQWKDHINHNRLSPALHRMEQIGEPQDNETLARLCYMNKYHFMKTFRQVMHISPQQYKIRIIIQKSQHLLEHTDMKVTEIAAQLGVEDGLYFSRLFKKHTGMSPTAYRKQNK